jgi:hypothetical protein
MVHRSVTGSYIEPVSGLERGGKIRLGLANGIDKGKLLG